MKKEFKELFKELINDPAAAADKMNDENYKKVLSEKVYNWHNEQRKDSTWADYILVVLQENFDEFGM